MNNRNPLACTARACALLCAVSIASTTLAADFDDGNNRLWRQVKDTTGLTWDQVASVCSIDGETPCSGAVGGKDLTGWVWATQDQVRDLMAIFAPDIAELNQVSGPAYTLPGFGFLSTFLPTYAFYIESANYESVTGWTSTLASPTSARMGHASVSWPAFNGTFSVAATADPATASSQRGVWLWKWINPPPACPADLTGDGAVDSADLNILLAAFGADTSGDITGDGATDSADLNELLAAFGEPCDA